MNYTECSVEAVYVYFTECSVEAVCELYRMFCRSCVCVCIIQSVLLKLCVYYTGCSVEVVYVYVL